MFRSKVENDLCQTIQKSMARLFSFVVLKAEVSGLTRMGSEIKVQVSNVELLAAYICLGPERECYAIVKKKMQK